MQMQHTKKQKHLQKLNKLWQTNRKPKITRIDRQLVGFTQNFQISQLLQNQLQILMRFQYLAQLMYSGNQEQGHFSIDLVEQRLQNLQNLQQMINEYTQMYRELCRDDKEENQHSLFDLEVEEEIMNIHTLFHSLAAQLGCKTQNAPLSASFLVASEDSKQVKILPQNCLQVNTQFTRPPKKVDLSRQKQRGPYRSYTREQKNHVVLLHQMGNTFAYISKQLSIPQKNVVRWCREGYTEQDSSKRLADSEMERSLATWLQSHPNRIKLSYSDIQTKALEFSSNTNFKGSRGWMKNFLKRRDPMLLRMISSSSKALDEEN